MGIRHPGSGRDLNASNTSRSPPARTKVPPLLLATPFSPLLQANPKAECQVVQRGGHCNDPRCCVRGWLNHAWDQRTLIVARLEEVVNQGRIAYEATLKLDSDWPRAI